MIKAPKTIIICGTGRNVGKTTYAQNLIRKFKGENPIAVKISSHFHHHNYKLKIVDANDDYKIWEEINLNNNTDSSKMLNAGAYKVFYIESKDECLPKVIDILRNIMDFNNRIIIESAAIRRYIVPAEFILIYSKEFPNIKKSMKDIESLTTSKVNLDIDDTYKS